MIKLMLVLTRTQNHIYILYLLTYYVLLIFQYIYAACGGTQKGIAFRDLLCGLVLLTRGLKEDKIKCKYCVFNMRVLFNLQLKIKEQLDGMKYKFEF